MMQCLILACIVVNVLKNKKKHRISDLDFYKYSYFSYFLVTFNGIHQVRLIKLPTFPHDMYLPKLFGYLINYLDGPFHATSLGKKLYKSQEKVPLMVRYMDNIELSSD